MYFSITNNIVHSCFSSVNNYHCLLSHLGRPCMIYVITFHTMNDPILQSSTMNVLGWTCNPAESWTCNPVASWTCNPAASWTCNPAASWTCNPVASWTCNPVASWTCNPVASWTCNPVASWTCNPVASWTCNPVASWTCNPAASWTCNPVASWTCNPAATWTYNSVAMFKKCDKGKGRLGGPAQVWGFDGDMLVILGLKRNQIYASPFLPLYL